MPSAKQRRQGGAQEKHVTQLLRIHTALTWSKTPMQKCHPSAQGRKETEPVRRILGSVVGSRECLRRLYSCALLC